MGIGKSGPSLPIVEVILRRHHHFTTREEQRCAEITGERNLTRISCICVGVGGCLQQAREDRPPRADVGAEQRGPRLLI